MKKFLNGILLLTLFSTLFYFYDFYPSQRNEKKLKSPLYDTKCIQVVIDKTDFKSVSLLTHQKIDAGYGIKSLIFNKKGNEMYALNLESMSIYVYDSHQHLKKKLLFEKNVGEGWDYSLNKSINSYQEKPVEGHFTNDFNIFFASLHNAGGIVSWDSRLSNFISADFKRCQLYLYDTDTVCQQIKLPFFKTGKTPKVICSSKNDSLLFITNWHSKSLTIIDKSNEDFKEWRILQNLQLDFIPRGICYIDSLNTIYIAAMSSNFLMTLNLNSMQSSFINVGKGPRHIVHYGDYLFISLNSASEIVKIKLENNKIIKRAKCISSPRTIKVTNDGEFIFVTNYSKDYLQCFNTETLDEVGRWKTDHHPVALEIMDSSNGYSVWVGNYSSGTIDIFNFEPKL